MSKRLLAVILCCAALYLLGNGRTSLWDRDEPRYAQAARQMLQSGDYVMPRLLDEPRINKPPLIYWCQAAAMRVLGDNAFAARLPSSIAMTITLVLLATVLARWTGEERAFWSVTIFGTSGLVVMAAKMSLTDAVLLLFVTTAQLALYTMWRGRATWPAVLTFATTTALGLLTKGPVVLGVNITTLLTLAALRLLDRARKEPRGFEVVVPGSAPQPTPTPAPVGPDSSRPGTSPLSLTLKLLAATALIAAITLPWILAMQSRLPGGLKKTFDHDVVNRITQPLEQHKGPPGFYLVFALASFFPWCLLLPTAAKIAWRHRHDPLLRFSLAATIGPWIMFELIQTKLPHYVLPCFPFLAIFTADTLVRCADGQYDDWRMRRWTTAVAVWSGAVVLLGLAPWIAALPRFAFPDLPYAAMTAVSLAAIAFAFTTHHLFAHFRVRAAAHAMAATVVGMFVLLYGWYLPNAPFLHLSARVGHYLQSIGATTPGDVAMIDYKEDTLPFYQGGTIRPQRLNTYLTTEPPENWPTYLVITREIWTQTPTPTRAHLEVLQTFRGWSYAAKGRVVEVLIVKKRPPPFSPG